MTELYAVPESLLARCGGRQDLARRVVGVFVEQVTDDVRRLEEELRDGQAEAAAKLAHRIKGASANVCAEELRQDAERVEELTRQQRLEDTREPLEKLELELQSYIELTSAFLTSTEPDRAN